MNFTPKSTGAPENESRQAVAVGVHHGVRHRLDDGERHRPVIFKRMAVAELGDGVARGCDAGGVAGNSSSSGPADEGARSRPWSGKMQLPEPRTSMQGGEMGVLDKVKAAAGRATTKAQEGVATVQTKRKLTQAYGELGHTTYELVQSGELTHPRLSPTVERISAGKAQLEREERAEGPPPSPASAPGTPPESPTLPPVERHV